MEAAGLEGPVAANWFTYSAAEGNGTEGGPATQPELYQGAGVRVERMGVVGLMAAVVGLALLL